MITICKKMFADKDFMSKTLRIALPVTLQAMLNMITTMVDTFMIGKLGESAIGGVGLASKVFFVFILIVFGVASGTSVLVAQYWGNDDIKHIRQVVGLGLKISFAAGLILCGIAFFAPESVMRILTDSPSLIRTGSEYLRICGLTYPLTAVSYTLAAGMRSIGEAKAPTVISAIAILCNIIGNYILIFGKLGAPQLGISGAAIATFLSRVVEIVLYLVVLKVGKSPLSEQLRDYISCEAAVVRQFLHDASPVLINECLWGIGMTMYSLIYGRMGESAAAAMTIVSTYQDIEVVGLQGLSTATAVMLGNELGAGRLREAKIHSEYFMVFGALASLALIIITLGVMKPYTAAFEVSPEAERTIILCLIVFAASMMARGQNNILIIGTLRSGGDTVACALLDLMPQWLFSVPLAFIGGLVWKLPVWIVFTLAGSDEIIKFVIGRIRYKQYKWLKNLNTQLEEYEVTGN